MTGITGTLRDISLNSSQNEKRFRKKVIEEIKTHILCSIKWFR